MVHFLGLNARVIGFMMIGIVLFACKDNSPNSQNSMKFETIPVSYPHTEKDTTVSDEYFGTTVSDPYRWLEDDQSDETKDWVKKQNLVTFGYLSQVPFREKIQKRLEEIWNFEKYGTPFKEGEKYYFFKNDGLQNQSVLYVQDSPDGKATVLLDPNTFSEDGTTSIQGLEFSQDGKYLAYAISEGGSDWRTILVMNAETGEMENDRIEWAKFTGIAWKGEGFYYTRYPEPKEGEELTAANQNSSIYYHKLGTEQADDEQVFKDPEHPNHYFSAGTTEDERFLLLYGSESTSGNTLAFQDLENENAEWVKLSTDFDNEYGIVDNVGERLFILTNLDAPRQRLVAVDTNNPERSKWETIIPENSEDVLQSVNLCGGKFVCEYLHNAYSVLRVYDLAGKMLGEVELPEIGSVGALNGEKDESTAFFSFQSFLRPNTIYTLDMESLKVKLFKKPELSFESDNYTTEQVWYESKDGTKVPMFITRKKKISKDGKNPTLLYGYGGFNIPLTPGFSPSRAALLENDGIYVVANIRGGGEFGEEWHKAGTKCEKQNVFDDFIAAAEYLIDQKYTSPEKLAIEGGSNGGLLVGACMTQRPDLFGVCFPRVGVLDMLRYHQFTIGYAWAVDYGRSDVEEEFPCLFAYSPLHNVKETEYPATMITTADHDDRVVPAHSFKFAATLQEYQQGDDPILIRIETSAGHGAGKPTSKYLEEAADMLSFMFYEMKKGY